MLALNEGWSSAPSPSGHAPEWRLRCVAAVVRAVADELGAREAACKLVARGFFNDTEKFDVPATIINTCTDIESGPLQCATATIAHHTIAHHDADGELVCFSLGLLGEYTRVLHYASSPYRAPHVGEVVAWGVRQQPPALPAALAAAANLLGSPQTSSPARQAAATLFLGACLCMRWLQLGDPSPSPSSLSSLASLAARSEASGASATHHLALARSLIAIRGQQPAPVADTLRRAYAALVVSCNPLQYQPLLALSLEQLCGSSEDAVVLAVEAMSDVVTRSQVRGKREAMGEGAQRMLNALSLLTDHFSANARVVSAVCALLNAYLSKFQSYPVRSVVMSAMFQVLGPCMQALTTDTFHPVYLVLLACVKYRAGAVYRSLPLFVRHCRALLAFAVVAASKEGDGFPHTHTEDVSRLFAECSKPVHQKKLSKYVAYIIHEYIGLAKHHALTGTHERQCRAGIHSLMSHCSEYEFKQIYATLDGGGRSIFKEVHSSFNKTKYIGKN